MARLEIRPNCELCDRDLPPESSEARICSYECTYCADCAAKVLHNVCATCGGNIERRPIRPVRSWRPSETLGLANHPAGTKRVHSPFSREDIAAHVAMIRHIPPDKR